jgi:hypothetical protein
MGLKAREPTLCWFMHPWCAENQGSHRKRGSPEYLWRHPGPICAELVCAVPWGVRETSERVRAPLGPPAHRERQAAGMASGANHPAGGLEHHPGGHVALLALCAERCRSHCRNVHDAVHRHQCPSLWLTPPLHHQGVPPFFSSPNSWECGT